MTDCIIVGGGVIGMLTARELRQRGFAVRLLERRECGGEASWAGGGILAPLYPWRQPRAVNDLARESHLRCAWLFEQLHAQTGIDPQHERSGLLVLDPPPRSEAEGWAQRHGFRCEHIGAAQVGELAPQLAIGPRLAAWLPELGQVRPPRLMRALRRAVALDGVEVREGEAVNGLLVERGRVAGVRSARGEIRAPLVVLAGGAWSGLPIANLPLPPRVRPIRGQIILVRAQPGLLKQIVLYRDRYLIPRRDGRILIGSTLEETGFAKQTTEAARRQLWQHATECLPALGHYGIEHQWAGLRPGSEDGVPYICEHPQLPGLFLNTGHHRNGIVTGLASAQLCAQLISADKPLLDPAAYAFERRAASL